MNVIAISFNENSIILEIYFIHRDTFHYVDLQTLMLEVNVDVGLTISKAVVR